MRRGQQVRATWSAGAGKLEGAAKPGGSAGSLETWSTGADVGQQVRRNVVNRCGRGSTGAAKRGQQVRTWVNRCGETWSTGADVGQQVRRNVVNRCGRGSTGAAKRGVRRGAETWSAGAARRGQQVRRNAVSRCGKRGQPVRETRSTGAWNAVNRCGETLFSPMFSRFCEPCPIFPISPIFPGKGRGKRAGGGVLCR